MLLLATPVVASDLVSATQYIPVVSRTPGLAGTQWSTSVRITNPHDDPLTITARLSMDGAIQTETVQVAARETRAWSDFLGEVFVADGNGALMLEAEGVLNQDRPPECRTFAASTRISTLGIDGGSYGQGIPSLDPVTGFLGDWTAVFPAVSVSGQPGVDGFRTNVGFWNIGSETAQLRLRLLDATGTQVWQQWIGVSRHTPMVMGLPVSLQTDAATLLVDTLGEWLDCAVYISVVDNTTGDATFLPSQLLDPDAAAVCSSGFAAETAPAIDRRRTPERLRTVFLGNPQ